MPSRGSGAASGRSGRRRSTYPKRLGVWPGAVFLACFAALELAYAEPASPRALALAVALYSYAMWFGMAAYGRRTWDEHGNGFTVYFGLLARIAPFGEHDGRLVVRMPFSGLAGAERTPGMLAFVAVMLGSVGFDGLSRAPFWQNLRADLEGPYVVDAPRTAELRHDRARPSPACVGCILLVAVRLPRARPRSPSRMVASERPLAPEFIQSLVPIALVYAVAHYFTAFVITGQYIFSLASDPFGFGWDLFGTVTYSPNIAPFPPNVGLVRPVRRARRRARGGPRSRARPRGHDPAGNATRSAPSTPCSG